MLAAGEQGLRKCDVSNCDWLEAREFNKALLTETLPRLQQRQLKGQHLNLQWREIIISLNNVKMFKEAEKLWH